ncbi:MAG: recombination-associated protein RdgC [Proteobacteria bacterium]|nr:recombination-associated protein RdgC [Pseudomonadota bacterium]
MPFRLQAASLPDLDGARDALAAQLFTPCGLSQPQSIGFVPPRGVDHAPLIEAVAGGRHWLLQVRSQQRLLPASVVREQVQEAAERIEAETGRKPGRKALAELKEEVVHRLLPQAFTKTVEQRIWLDLHGGWLLLDAGSMAKADALISLLVAALPGLAVAPLHTAESPAACMTAWLLDGVAPEGFSIGRDTELRSPGDERATVRYVRHALEGDDVRAHLQEGKRPTRLALAWRDRVALTLTETLTLKGVALLDVVLEQRGSPQGADEAFDADAALTVLELGPLLPALVEALGGEAAPGTPGTQPAASAVSTSG